MISVDALREVLKPFGQVLRFGSHSPGDGEVCLLEAESVRLGIPFTDSPEQVDMWDLRDLNDVEVPARVRTKHLLPVWAAYIGSRSWPIARQHRVVKELALAIARELFLRTAPISSGVFQRCRDSKTLEEAVAAVRAARQEAGAAAETDGWDLGSRYHERYAHAEDVADAVLKALAAADAAGRLRYDVSRASSTATAATRQVICNAASDDKERLFREACRVFVARAGEMTS